MTRWVLLLRAVNLGAVNKLRMADLRELLEGLGYGDVRTYLNSGNATFEAAGTAKAHADAIETALEEDLGLGVRAVVRSTADVRAMVKGVPADLGKYSIVVVLADKAPAAAMRELEQWEPETVVAGRGCLYIGYREMVGSKLQNQYLEKLLGVAVTARTPRTLERLV